MSGKHVAKDQPATFEFNPANEKRIHEILKKYPPERKIRPAVAMDGGNISLRSFIDGVAEVELQD